LVTNQIINASPLIRRKLDIVFDLIEHVSRDYKRKKDYLKNWTKCKI